MVENRLTRRAALAGLAAVSVASAGSAAGEAAQALFGAMRRKGWHDARLLDATGKLTNKFLVVSNIKPDDASFVIGGNERVVRPRLADAKFFFDQDRKKTLESRVEALGKVVYHNKLGTQGERTERVRAIARAIGQQLGGEALAKAADTAARLAKTDLLTDMVGEFPELQGTMGRYYALHDGEQPARQVALLELAHIAEIAVLLEQVFDDAALTELQRQEPQVPWGRRTSKFRTVVILAVFIPSFFLTGAARSLSARGILSAATRTKHLFVTVTAGAAWACTAAYAYAVVELVA